MTEINVRNWLIKAMNDFRTVEHELKLQDKEVITDTVCFHSQQASEKMLKAFLISKGTDFGKTHNLDFLLKLCVEKDKEFESLSVGKLTEYAIGVRYPDEFYIPTLTEAKQSFEIAGKIIDFVLKKFNIHKDKLK